MIRTFKTDTNSPGLSFFCSPTCLAKSFFMVFFNQVLCSSMVPAIPFSASLFFSSSIKSFIFSISPSVWARQNVQEMGYRPSLFRLSVTLCSVFLTINMSRASRFFENDLPDYQMSATSQCIVDMHIAPEFGSHLRFDVAIRRIPQS